jgi:hypothetical protein
MTTCFRQNHSVTSVLYNIFYVSIFDVFFDQRSRDISDHFLFSFCSLVVLAVILPTAVEGLFPVIAVALGVSAVLIAKGIFWGAVIGGIIGGGYVARRSDWLREL